MIFYLARIDAGILMISSDIEIGDIGMLSYRLSTSQRSFHTRKQHQVARRSISCLVDQEQSKIPTKWELTSRTQILSNDPLGLLNHTLPIPTSQINTNRISSMMTSKPFTTSTSISSEIKPPLNRIPKEQEEEQRGGKGEEEEEERLSLLHIPTSITQLRAKFNHASFSALYNSKNLNTIKSFALDRFTDLKTSVKSTAIPLTQSKSLYTVKNSTNNKARISISNNKLRGSMSSLISQQSSNSSSLNTNNINGMGINNISDDIKALRIDPSSVAIPINSNDESSYVPFRIIEISSCNRCSVCTQFLYDEEIMNGWSPDDSQLHTMCVHCGEKTIPNLSITIRVRYFI